MRDFQHWWEVKLCLQLVIGNLSNNDDNGTESVAKKMNLHPFQLYHIYLDALNLSNVGDFSLSWILKDCKQLQKKGKFVDRRMFTSSIKRGIRWFPIIVMQWTSNWNVLKSMKSCCFAHKTNCIWRCHCCCCRCGCLSSLITKAELLLCPVAPGV